MGQIAAAIVDIEAAAKRLGLGKLAREAGLPDRTVRDLADKGFRTKAVSTLERLHEVAAKGEGGR